MRAPAAADDFLDQGGEFVSRAAGDAGDQPLLGEALGDGAACRIARPNDQCCAVFSGVQMYCHCMLRF